MKRKLILLIVALLAVLSLTAASAQSFSAYFNTSSKVYKKASSHSASAEVKKGTKCTIVDVDGNWAKVKKDGVTAYCDVRDLTLSSRIKGYIKKDTKCYKTASSSKTLAKLPVNSEVYIIGRSGSYWRVENKSGSMTGYVKMKYVGTDKVSGGSGSSEAPSGSVNGIKVLDWYDGGSSVVKRGGNATVYDIKSGRSFRVHRMGGSSHADLEPLTAADTETLKDIVGHYSWDCRPVILINGDKKVCASINTMPHGDQTIRDNGYEGQFCLHMVNSRTHGTDKINEEHQKAIRSAWSWAQKQG